MMKLTGSTATAIQNDALSEEITSLREQLSDMVAVVAQLERERDFWASAHKVDIRKLGYELAAMTKERDELVAAVKAIVADADEFEQRTGNKIVGWLDGARAALAKVGEKL